MHGFELYDGIKDTEGYGKYLIYESGHFDYMPSLDKYIDFRWEAGRRKQGQGVWKSGKNKGWINQPTIEQ